MGRCSHCNGNEWTTIQSWDGWSQRRCYDCGRDRPDDTGMLFRQWKGSVVHVVDVPGRRVVDVWCGPPAPLPEPPSPEDILRACGIDPVTVFCE